MLFVILVKSVNGNIPSGHLKKRNVKVLMSIDGRFMQCVELVMGLERFLMLMNHPPPMHERSYRKIGYKFYDGVKDVDEVCSQSTGYTEEDDNIIMGTGVSLDGTWQKRGFISYNGAVMTISINIGKILDLEVISPYCQYCVDIEVYEKDDIVLYDKLKHDHICSINHHGSAPKMEQEGVERNFGRSIKNNKIRYTAIPSRFLLKRVGTRLRKLKKNKESLV